MNDTGGTFERNDLYRADDRTRLLFVNDGIVFYGLENPTTWLTSDKSVPSPSEATFI